MHANLHAPNACYETAMFCGTLSLIGAKSGVTLRSGSFPPNVAPTFETEDTP